MSVTALRFVAPGHATGQCTGITYLLSITLPSGTLPPVHCPGVRGTSADKRKRLASTLSAPASVSC